MTSTRDDASSNVSPSVGNARVRAAIAPMLVEPRVSSGQTSQALAGHVLEVLERREDWRRVRGRDGYPGWVHAGYLDETASAGSPQSGGTRISTGCVVIAHDKRRALPLGALLDATDRVVSGEALGIGDELRRRYPPGDIGSIIRAAVELFASTSYQWGGVTPWGADCSGFVQAIYNLHGYEMPRDAWQQALEGVDASAAVDAVLAGDLLFFSDREDGRITHVGISTGERRMAHIALGRGGFRVEDLGDVSDPYVAKLRERYRGARRVL